MKLFEDLPNTDTPINAENLNQIQDKLVVVSATEPTGDNREKVWIQKGKNLYNVNKRLMGRYIDETTGDLIVQPSSDITANTNVGHVTEKIPCLGNTTYTISGENNRNRWIEYYDDGSHSLPTYNTSFTTSSNAKYIQCYFYAGVSDISSLKIQIEQGTTATEYEEYIEPKIYVKNDNGVYEEFISKEDTLERYSTEEQKIGTWIDGKPLYRKVISLLGSQFTKQEQGLPLNIENVKEIVDFECIFKQNGVTYRKLSTNFYGDARWDGQVNLTTTSIIFELGTETLSAIKSSTSIYLFVNYTKTTD